MSREGGERAWRDVRTALRQPLEGGWDGMSQRDIDMHSELGDQAKQRRGGRGEAKF